MVASWLQEHGRTPDSALDELSAKWKRVKKSCTQRASPETASQVDWVRTWPQRRKSVQQLMLCDRYRGALLGLLGVLNGRSKEDILGPFFFSGSGRDYWCHGLSPEIAEIADGSFKVKEPPGIIGSGFVARSLEAALWAFHCSDSFREGALRAVNLGDDADTTGAIYGQLAGAYYGVNAIPQNWIERVAWREYINEMAIALFHFSNE